MFGSAADHFAVDCILFVIALGWLCQSIRCSVRLGHCTCEVCTVGNRLPTITVTGRKR